MKIATFQVRTRNAPYCFLEKFEILRILIYFEILYFKLKPPMTLGLPYCIAYICMNVHTSLAGGIAYFPERRTNHTTNGGIVQIQVLHWDLGQAIGMTRSIIIIILRSLRIAWVNVALSIMSVDALYSSAC